MLQDNHSFTIRKVGNATFTVLYNVAGKVEGLELKQGGMTLTLPRIN